MKIVLKKSQELSDADNLKSSARVVSFIGRYSFLSNDFPHSFMHGGRIHPTAYHAYLSASTSVSSDRDKIAAVRNPQVLRFIVSRQISIGIGWYEHREFAMREILKEKFADPSMAAMLIATGNAELINAVEYDDAFWGVFRKKGRNMLGTMLMQLRDELKRGQRR